VLDAIIDYGGALVVVVENKVAESDDYQARHLDLAGACVRIGEKQARVEVVWRQVIESLVSLQEKRLVNGAEAVLLEDFLTYVEDYFPSLGPLRTLALCRRNYGRMERRLRQLLAETAEANAVWSSYRPMVRLRSDLVAHAYLGVDDDVKLVELSAFPADTLGQARILYERPDVVDALAALDDRPEWSVTPNFHFGFTQRNYCWTRGEIGTDEYLRLWRERVPAGEGAVGRDSWDSYWRELVELGVADPRDRAEFDRHFTETDRASASPRPGLWIRRRWPVADAEALDQARALTGEIREALGELLAVCDASIERVEAVE
jgi:hypothetical protein